MSTILSHHLVSGSSAPSSLSASFAISSPPGADKWRSPPSHLVSTAPVISTLVPATSFRSVRVSVKFSPKDLYDQAGLILLFGDQKWIKAGVELKDGAYLSCVATQGYSDWSLTPLADAHQSSNREGSEVSVTLMLERALTDDGSPKSALWVYVLLPDGQLQPMREITWAFEDTDAKELEVGCYVACPSTTRDGNLTAHFSNFQLH